MRLIDADSLKDDGCNYVWAETIGFGMAKKEYRFVNRIQIDNASTVEAIPIEWIEKWIEIDRNAKRRTPYYYKRLFRSRLKMMLEDWRKENG